MLCKSSKKTRGAAMMELALLSPWIIFLFIGVLDWGFYANALVTVENATRVAGAYASYNTSQAVDTDNICTVLLNEMGSLSNMQGVTSCTSSPLVLSATLLTNAGPDGSTASKVSVTYTTPAMIPIPGLLAKQFTITRTVTMRI